MLEPPTVLACLTDAGLRVRGLADAWRGPLLASGGNFTTYDLIAVLVFTVDLILAPLSALLLILALVTRRRDWTWELRIGAILNLLFSLILLPAIRGDAPLAFALLGLQLIVSVAVLVVLRHPTWCVKVFGVRTQRT